MNGKDTFYAAWVEMCGVQHWFTFDEDGEDTAPALFEKRECLVSCVNNEHPDMTLRLVVPVTLAQPYLTNMTDGN